ncbi:MAG: hypothetical protein ACP5GH_01420 [Nitrososphaeria archaeon]
MSRYRQNWLKVWVSQRVQDMHRREHKERYVKAVITADVRTKKFIDVHAYTGEGSEAKWL